MNSQEYRETPPTPKLNKSKSKKRLTIKEIKKESKQKSRTLKQSKSAVKSDKGTSKKPAANTQ